MSNRGRTGIGSLLLLLIFGWLELGGLVHSASAHSGADFAVAFFVPPWAWYRSVEFFWHEGPSQASSALDPETLVQEYDIDRKRAELISRLATRYMEEIGGAEAYRDVMLKIGAEPEPQSVMNHAFDLSMRGSVRLGKTATDSLAALRSALFKEFGEERCELLVGGAEGPGAGWQLMAAVDSTTLVDFFNFQAKATQAVIEEAGDAPKFDRERLVAAWRDFHERLPPAEQDRFTRFLDDPLKSVEERCWFQRRLWTLLPELPEGDARVIVWQLGTNRE